MAERLDRALHQAGVIYWNRGSACAPWRLEQDVDEESGALEESWSLVHEVVADGWHRRSSYGYAARGHEAFLAGPSTVTEPVPGDGSMTAEGAYCVVSLPIRDLTSEFAEVGDFRWYFTRAACERDGGSRPVLATRCAAHDERADAGQSSSNATNRPARSRSIATTTISNVVSVSWTPVTTQ
ncbi:MAG: hypothetical protein K8W52_21345 [Deltaproteobacteria bacterium]|nr:hypothetical protein [Deltaproteobacteria bacterium]